MAYSSQGTGTSADPYQVTTIEQLVECFSIYNNISISGGKILVYCKLMNDLNFNDSQYWDCPQDLFKANNTSSNTNSGDHAIYIDGNGYGIYNLYCYNKNGIFSTPCSGSAYHNQIVISNCILECIVIKSKTYSCLIRYNATHYNSGVKFKNCDLRIKYYRYGNDAYDENLLGCSVFTNCIINIDIILNADGFSNYGYSLLESESDINSSYANYYNEWNIRVLMIQDPSNAKTFGMFNISPHQFSSFFIELIAMKGNNWTITTASPSIFNCYFVIKNTLTSGSYKAKQVIGATKYGINFYDADVADSTITDSTSGNGALLALTTAQCKNAEYLEQQGFIIAQ